MLSLLKPFFFKFFSNAFKTDLIHLVKNDKYSIKAFLRETTVLCHCLQDLSVIDTDCKVMEIQFAKQSSL